MLLNAQFGVLLFFMLMMSVCHARPDAVSSPSSLTIVTVFAYDKVQHQIPWHIRGYLLGFRELQAALSSNLNITHKFVWQKGVSACADVMSLIVTWASKEYHAAYAKGQAVSFCSPGCFQEILELGRIAREWNVLFMTTLGSNYVITPTKFPTIVSMSYRQQRSFAQFFIKFFGLFSWKTSLWLCDQDQTVSAFTSSTCSNAGKLIQNDYRFVTYMVDFNSRQRWDATEILRQNTPLARIIILSATADIVRLIMISAAALGLIGGDYVFITIQELSNSFDVWKQGDDSDDVVARAYRALFIFTVDGPFTQEAVSKFEKQLRSVENDTIIQKYLKDKVFDRATLLDNSKPYNLVNYQAMIALQQMLSLALRTGISLKDGRSLAYLFHNTNFTTEYSNFFVDDEALRVPPMVVQDFNFTTGTFTNVILGLVEPGGFALVQVKDSVIDWGGNRTTPPPDEPECGFQGTSRACLHGWLTTETLIGICVGICLAFATGMFFWATVLSRWNSQRGSWWQLDSSLLVLTGTSQDQKGPTAAPQETDNKSGAGSGTRYAGIRIDAKTLILPSANPIMPSKKLRIFLFQLKELNSHLKINPFTGICQHEDRIYLISGWCEKGSLFNFLNSQTDLSGSYGMLKSFIWDIITGLNYIHSSQVVRHGFLTSLACCVDKHFTVKICRLGYDKIQTLLHILPDGDEEQCLNFWSAPETVAAHVVRSQKSDVYSLAVIMGEILLGRDPYAIQEGLSPHGFIQMVREKQVECDYQPAKMVQLMHSCWNEDPASRPSLKQVMKQYTQIAGGRPANVTQDLLKRLHRYSQVLEDSVVQRIAELREEQAYVDQMLCQVMPTHVVKELRAGRVVPAESFEKVTICFTSVEGFAEYVQSAPPFKVVEFLNTMVEQFERTIESMDVYRVEITGDSHVLASGLPLRNGDLHAREICTAVLRLLKHYSAPYWMELNPTLLLKTGVHTGPVVTAVAGVKLPKYSLFGDTINTASRMMSTSAGNCLHASEQTQLLLTECKEFTCVNRGLIQVKGKGEMRTFWIEKAQ